MKKIVLIVFAFLLMGIGDAYSQVIKMEHGFSYSNMNKGVFDEMQPSYLFMLGCDYLDRSWFYLSSEIGYTQKGGQYTTEGTLPIPSGPDYLIKSRNRAKFNYLHINTSFRIKHSFNKITLYVGIAPTLEFLVCDNSEAKSRAFEYYDVTYKVKEHSNNVIIGIQPELGMYYNLNERLSAILNLSYLRTLNAVGNSNGTHFYNQSVSLSLGIGYRL